MTCKHDWEALYKLPEDSKFLEIYKAKRLNTWHICRHCGATGRTRDNKVQATPKRKHATHRADAQKWSEALSQWESTLSHKAQ